MMKLNIESGKKLDCSKQGLKKLPKDLENLELCSEVNVDDNEFTRLEGFDQFKNLRKLSARRNSLVKIIGLSRLSELVELDLSQNSIQSVENLKSLRLLEKLNLSGNDIKTFSLLNANSKLRYLDLSDNSITSLSDISSLHELQTLDLSRNVISSLATASKCLPPSLVSLSISENEIADLCEISCLHFLAELEYLGFAHNHCVSNAPCDYRPYIVNWCYKLKILDGLPISQQERLKAEWLFSQGHGRRFNLGQHIQLVEYLAICCPLNRAKLNGSTTPVREAWASRDFQPVAFNPSVKAQLSTNDLVVEDVTQIRESHESTSRLQSDSVFIPVTQSHDNQSQDADDVRIIQNIQKRLAADGASRPMTAPTNGRNGASLSPSNDSDSETATSHTKTSVNQVVNTASPIRATARPRTSPSSASSVNKYEEYESRPCRPMSKELMKELFNEENNQRQQQLQKAVKPLANGRPSTSAANLASIQEKVAAQRRDLPAEVQQKSSNENSRMRLRRPRVSTNSSADLRSVESARTETTDRTMATPEFSNRSDPATIAATKIQASWRGFLARRELQPKLRMLAFRRYGNLIASLMEMRRADAEHIRQLEETLAERDRQERKARRLQTAAIKQLWEQVQSMKQQLSALTGSEISRNPVLQSSMASQSQTDENVSGIPLPNGPLSSVVSDSVRTERSMSPSALLSSPARRGLQTADFGNTRRSPYAVKQVKAVIANGSTPTKVPLTGDELGRAAASSPLATPPRTRQTAVGAVNGSTLPVSSGTVSGETRRMAFAAKFSYLPESYRSHSNNELSGTAEANSQDSN